MAKTVVTLLITAAVICGIVIFFAKVWMAAGEPPARIMPDDSIQKFRIIILPTSPEEREAFWRHINDSLTLLYRTDTDHSDGHTSRRLKKEDAVRLDGDSETVYNKISLWRWHKGEVIAIKPNKTWHWLILDRQAWYKAKYWRDSL